MTAGYLNGYASVQWSEVTPPDVWFDVFGSDIRADAVDCEPGNATPSQAATWAKRKRNAWPELYPPIIYTIRDWLTPVFNACDALNLEIVRDFRIAISTLDGTETVSDMTGVTFVQAWGAKMLGFHADASIVYDNNWKRTVAPGMPPLPGIWHEIISVTPEGNGYVVIGLGVDLCLWKCVGDGTTWQHPVKVSGQVSFG